MGRGGEEEREESKANHEKCPAADRHYGTIGIRGGITILDFRVEEATITGVHRAFRAKKLTAAELVSRYFERIRAYNGVCVRGDVDAATGLQLGDITPIPDAGQLNAFITLNLKEDKRIKLGDLAAGE